MWRGALNVMVSGVDYGSSCAGYVICWATALCSWARRLTLTVPLSTPVCNQVLMSCWGNHIQWGGILLAT